MNINRITLVFSATNKLHFFTFVVMKHGRIRKAFFNGVRDGFPIGMGYFAVAFSLGIVAQSAGLNAVEGFFASLFNVASAGEYALFTSVKAGATYIEVALATFIINARYLLMSCSLSQKFSPSTGFSHRLLVGFGITDEIFGISIARPGRLMPAYNYGAMAISIPLWAVGTSLGIYAGDLLPARVVSAFSVALYGMFIAIIVPPAKENKAIFFAIMISFMLSLLCAHAPYVCELSEGTRIILLTVVIAAALAVVAPIQDRIEKI